MSTPLVEIHDQIWTTLETDPAFTALVPAGNRVKYRTKRDDTKRHALTNDFPEVRVRSLQCDFNRVRDTAEHGCTWQFVIEAAFGEKTVGNLYDLTWYVWKAMERIQDDFDTAYEAGDDYKVIQCDPISVETTLDNHRLNRGTNEAWSSLFAGEITFVVPRSVLTAQPEE